MSAMSSLRRKTDMFARAAANKRALEVGGVVSRTAKNKKGEKREIIVTRYTQEYIDLQTKKLLQRVRRAYNRVLEGRQ